MYFYEILDDIKKITYNDYLYNLFKGFFVKNSYFFNFLCNLLNVNKYCIIKNECVLCKIKTNELIKHWWENCIKIDRNELELYQIKPFNIRYLKETNLIINWFMKKLQLCEELGFS